MRTGKPAEGIYHPDIHLLAYRLGHHPPPFVPRVLVTNQFQENSSWSIGNPNMIGRRTLNVGIDDPLR